MILTFKNKTKNPFKNILLFILISLLFSCTNSYDSMIDSFNRKYFSPEPPEENYSITNIDFDASGMLEDAYVFPSDMYVNLEAPEDGTSYLWKCVSDDGTETEIAKTRILYFKAPGVFKKGEENFLILIVTATDLEGNVIEYTDKAEVIIKKSANSSEEGEL